MSRSPFERLYFCLMIVACCFVNCAPAARENNVGFGVEQTGGNSVSQGGRGGNSSQGGSPLPASAGANGQVDASEPQGKTDGGAQDGPLDPHEQPAKLDAAPILDVAPKLDATPKLDAASPNKPPLLGETMDCNAALPAASDVIATFEGSTVETLAAGNRAIGAPAQVYVDGTPGTATTSILAEARCKSTKSGLLSGGGFTFWGAVLALDFKGPTEPRQFYDVSGYQGIAFYARAASALTVRVKISDKNNVRWGGVCDAVKGECDDYWGRQLKISTEWKRYYLSFSDLDTQRPPLFGAFLATQTTGIEFVAPKETTFELHIDDISFVN